MFDLGADDYVTKPFDMREIVARTIALFKRKDKILEEIIHFDTYTIEV
jgi:DNA-binding response OmpR family regulator